MSIQTYEKLSKRGTYRKMRGEENYHGIVTVSNKNRDI